MTRLFRARRIPNGDAARARPASGLRILGWSTLAALLIGVLEFAQPVDDYLRMVRNMVRAKSPSGQIVVVGIDDRSVEQIGAWPWPRRRYAELIDRLSADGVDRIFFDLFFSSRSSAYDDAALRDALRRSGKVYLAARRARVGASFDFRAKVPLPEFTKFAHTVTVRAKYDTAGVVRYIPMSQNFGASTFPSMPSAIARVAGPATDRIFIDYAIDATRIPYVSISDVLSQRLPPGFFDRKTVIIGTASAELGDLYLVPGLGQTNGVFVNALAAETLRAGKIKHLGWFVPLVIIAIFATLNLFTRRRWIGRISVTIATLLVIPGPLVAENYGIFFDAMPAIVLLAGTAGSRAWFSFRRSYKVLGNINAISGLPNLNALRDQQVKPDTVVIGARVRNYAEITSSLPPDGERALVEQIVARLSLGADGAIIHQGDEGTFVWTTAPDVVAADQLDALYALFRSPALIEGRLIDLMVTLGIDADSSRTLANRIGATLVAADEAAVEGVRWKAYDSAKLADAEWKLSLLGRLDAAIDSGEVWVAYQPQLDLASGCLSGAEALVRWSHPEKGDVSPMEFVIAAEQYNRIDKLTAFVLEDAIRAAAAFHAKGVAFDVAVNISARLLEKPGLVSMVWKMLTDSGLPPERLTLEVTESAALTTDRTSIRTLEEVGSLGINVSIDDYGTGFSTLEYFKKIPATEVKIDRSFIASIDSNAGDRLMVQSTIELAHSLGRTVVAEGVETHAILAELTNLGCDKIQGYLIGRPMKLAALIEVMAGRSISLAA